MLTWLADVLRAANLSVIETAAWRTRGHGDVADIRGVLCHHTAGPATGAFPSLGIVRDGRPDLAGPLANLGLGRDGTWYAIAAGQAWHAGTGSIAWCPTDEGNPHLIGIEAESTGAPDDWPAVQLASYARGVAALLTHLGLGSYRCIGHKEWAPARKIDPSFDMTMFRASVARWMTEGPDVELTDRLPDLYTTNPGDSMTVGDTLAWACAHAARAKDAAQNAAMSAARIEAAVGQILTAVKAQQHG